MKVNKKDTIKLKQLWTAHGFEGVPKKRDRDKLRWQSSPGGVLRLLAASDRAHGDRWEWKMDDTDELEKVVMVLKGPRPPANWDTKLYKEGEKESDSGSE